MDIYTQVLIGLAVFILSALLIWFISAFSMKEKTFEEVMEEQRRQQEEEKEKIRAEKRVEKEKHKNKFKKGKPDKVKEKPVAVVEPEITEVHKMVQLEIEPEIIAPTETLGLSASPSGLRNRGKKEKTVKSILHNKDEKPFVESKASEIAHKISPKDEVELKKTHEKVAVVEKMEIAQVSVAQALPPTKEKKSKADHKENMPPAKADKKEETRTGASKKSDDSAPMTPSRVISFVKSSKLSDNEVQTLIEILLNKQGVTPAPAMTEDSWNKKGQKGDSVSLLKKQLEEKEQALLEEKQVSLNANSRMKDIRTELMAEKSKAAATEKQLHDQLVRQKNEMDALQARMQKTHEQHVAENNALQTRLRQTEQNSDKSALTKITEEKKILEDTLNSKIKESTGMVDKLKNAEKEVAASASKVKAAENSKKTLENKIKTLEDKMKKMDEQKEVDTLMNKRVEEVTQELRKSEAKNASMIADVEKSNSAMATAQGEVSTLKAKLQELEAHLSKSDEVDGKLQSSERKRQDLEGNLKNLENQLTDLKKRIADKDNDIKKLQSENQTLSSENKTVKDKLQTSPATNGDMHGNEKQLSAKVKEVGELTANLEAQKKSVSSLQVQLDTRQSEVDDLKNQLSQQKTKNNELREKNWKAMEALEKAEKASADNVDRALKSARESTSSEIENYDKAVLQRLFPQVKLSDKLQHKEWMSSFEKLAAKEKSNNSDSDDRLKAVTDENKKLKSSISDESKKYTALESDNKKLKEEVENYQSIVSETETKLRQLEKSIDSEEKKWQEKLKECQASASNQNSSIEKVKELSSIVSQQEKQIADYRNVLTVTDERLQSYEQKIASEEKTWQKKLSSSEGELQQAREELNSFKSRSQENPGSQEDLSDLGFAYRCVEKSLTSIVDELQEKIVTLEADLVETKERIVVITKEKETTLQEVQIQLEQERKKNKELSMNTVKLNGIIKTGHDALTQEQELVRKLQGQLDNRSVASGVSEVEETDQVKRNTRRNQRKKKASTSKENGTSV